MGVGQQAASATGVEVCNDGGSARAAERHRQSDRTGGLLNGLDGYVISCHNECTTGGDTSCPIASCSPTRCSKFKFQLEHHWCYISLPVSVSDDCLCLDKQYGVS